MNLILKRQREILYNTGYHTLLSISYYHAPLFRPKVKQITINYTTTLLLLD